MAGRTLDQRTLSGFSNLPRQTKILLGVATIIIATFSIDLVSPHYFTAALLLNFFAVFLSSKLDAPRTAFGVMAVVTVLSVVGFVLKPESHTDFGVTNRLAIVTILWITAIYQSENAPKQSCFKTSVSIAVSSKQIRLAS